MKKKLFAPLTIILLLISLIGRSQVSVINIQLLPYNITPESMLGASVMNSGGAQQVEMISKLYNFNNELLLTVKSSRFILKAGLNSPFDVSRKAIGIEYSSVSQASYIKTTHSLPSGAFKVCVEVILSKTVEIADQFCDEIESDFNQYLYLVYPGDKDVIDSSTPLLVWSHSEPFSVLSQGEYYRMVVVEMKEKQSAEAAVTVNTPLMAKNYLTTHSLQYPYDAKELKAGNHYAWQVQKLANGIVTNKTEAWEFTIDAPVVIPDTKYSSLKKQLDGGYYTATNNKIFFRFQEAYTSGNITCKIYDAKRTEVKPKLNNDGVKNAPLDLKQNGYNRFEINLNELDVKPGYYTLEVKNEKGELYLLKFQVL